MNENDPYPEPFEWSNDYINDDEPLGLIPCPQHCEFGFLPLINGEMIVCPSCSMT